MLIIQHIWTIWTKKARGAAAPVRRPRLAEVYELPAMAGAGDALLHEIRAIEWEGDGIVERAGPVTREEWKTGLWNQGVRLEWHMKDGAAGIVLQKRSPALRTKWPAYLPSPLFALRPGETARIDWNGRLGFGSNHSSYYEQHTYWLALADAPEPRMFLDARPKKHVDFRADIY